MYGYIILITICNKTILILQKPQETEKTERPVLMNPPALVRQGTETLRREKPQSQLVAPKDVREIIYIYIIRYKINSR